MEVNSTFVKLPEGYNFRIENTIGKSYGVILIMPDQKEKRLSGKPNNPISFKSDPEKIYSIGDVCETLIKEKIGSGEEYYVHLHGYGYRTGKYFDACKRTTGLIDSSADENLTLNDDSCWKKISEGAINGSDIYVKKESENYTAVFQTRADIDAVIEYRYIFDRYPNGNAVWDAHLISGTALDFKLGYLKESFTCYECGKKVDHWLDLSGDLREKIKKLRDKYCGC